MAETIAESAILWYNICMSKHKYNQNHFNTIQLKIPVDLEKIIEISDPIYTFNEISVIFEFSAICLGFNLHKYHLKKQKALLAA